MKRFVVLAGLIAASATSAQAGVIPYPNAGSENSVAYTFTAAATGDLIGYFAGSSAAYTENVGVLINGVASPVLISNRSTLGQTFNFGPVTEGNSLVFFDNVINTGNTFYSMTSRNSDGASHVYSTSAAANQAYAGSPAGTYVAFEDVSFNAGSDKDYNDDTFVFTNTATRVAGAVPESSTWAMMLLGFGGLGFLVSRRLQKAGLRPLLASA